MCLESKYVQERRVSANHYEAAKLEHIYTLLCREWTVGDSASHPALTLS